MKVGCDVRRRQDYLTVHYPSEIFLLKVIRYPNRLYKINLKIDNPMCLNTRLEDGRRRYHVRLGHISSATMNKMYQKDIVHGVPKKRNQNL